MDQPEISQTELLEAVTRETRNALNHENIHSQHITDAMRQAFASNGSRTASPATKAETIPLVEAIKAAHQAGIARGDITKAIREASVDALEAIHERLQGPAPISASRRGWGPDSNTSPGGKGWGPGV